MRNVERDRADFLRLFRALDRALDEEAGTALARTPAELFEEVLGRTGTTPVHGRSTSTSASLADAIAAVGAVERRQRVLDPASGEGSLLLSVARSTPSALLEGREKDEFSWALSVVRLELHGVKADLRPSPSLGGPALSPADVVVLDPPLDNRREYVEWLRLALSALEPDGRAVVALPAFTADPARREWRDVGSMHATSLVHLPGRLRSDAGEPLVLWVLSSEKAEGDLREVDARDLGERRATHWVLSKRDVQELRFADSLTRPWRMRSDGYEHPSGSGLPVTFVNREAGSVLAAQAGRPAVWTTSDARECRLESVKPVAGPEWPPRPACLGALACPPAPGTAPGTARRRGAGRPRTETPPTDRVPGEAAVKFADGRLRLAATDLSNFLACRHLTRLDTLQSHGRLAAPRSSTSASRS